jgi:hypothetical protein
MGLVECCFGQQFAFADPQFGTFLNPIALIARSTGETIRISAKADSKNKRGVAAGQAASASRNDFVVTPEAWRKEENEAGHAGPHSCLAIPNSSVRVRQETRRVRHASDLQYGFEIDDDPND